MGITILEIFVISNVKCSTLSTIYKHVVHSILHKYIIPKSEITFHLKR